MENAAAVMGIENAPIKKQREKNEDRKTEVTPKSATGLQELLANLDEVYGINLTDFALTEAENKRGAEAEESFQKERATLLNLLDKVRDREAQTTLVRNFYLKMVKNGMMSPLDHPEGKQMLANLEEKILETKKQNLEMRKKWAREKFTAQGKEAAEIEEFLQTTYQWDEEKALQEAKAEAEDKIRKMGLTAALETVKLSYQRKATEAFNGFIAQNEIKSETIAEQKVIKEENLEEIKSDLAVDFEDGNFLFHATSVDKAIQILQSGQLMNSAALKSEGAELNGATNNSGFEGISWNFNQVEALPGDRYHLVGFVTSIDAALDHGQQLGVPSRAAPYELIQVSENLPVNDFYQTKN